MSLEGGDWRRWRAGKWFHSPYLWSCDRNLHSVQKGEFHTPRIHTTFG